MRHEPYNTEPGALDQFCWDCVDFVINMIDWIMNKCIENVLLPIGFSIFFILTFIFVVVCERNGFYFQLHSEHEKIIYTNESKVIVNSPEVKTVTINGDKNEIEILNNYIKESNTKKGKEKWE